MNFHIVSLFPENVKSMVSYSMLFNAMEKNLINISYIDLRQFGTGNYNRVDDTPAGGGAGMVLKIDCLVDALESIPTSRDNQLRILLTPSGTKYNQDRVKELSKTSKDIVLICGHYEGFDERIVKYIDEEYSVGDYVLTGGEIPAALVIDSVSRLVPGVLAKTASFEDESFEYNLVEYPHYTKPNEFRGAKIPDVLLQGNHDKITEWRRKQSVAKTAKNRPDLIEL